jgi:selenocysteine lyase/cysteine desulfurase
LAEMPLTRRDLMQGLGALSVVAAARSSAGTDNRQEDGASAKPSLPDKTAFSFTGTHLNAAFAHPLSIRARQTAARYIEERGRNVSRIWPIDNPRDNAVAAFAGLIHARPADVAVVPSTLEGENLLAAALGLGVGKGVVTDPYHYDASLMLYGEKHKHGMPLTILEPRGNRIDYDALDAAITAATRLVAISWVSSWTGFAHDLKSVCEIAHRKGALVYADIIQGVGALPLDVKECGVDFCCAGTYKWLMADFGTAFLYVRPEVLSQLSRVQIGWRGMQSFTPHFLPYDSAGPVGGDWVLRTDTAGTFEVSTPNWAALQIVGDSIGYITDLGIETLSRHRTPLLNRLQEELPHYGFQPLTPRDAQGPFVVFSYENAYARLGRRLEEQRIFVTCGKHRIRVATSVYNDMQDIEHLLRAIHS